MLNRLGRSGFLARRAAGGGAWDAAVEGLRYGAIPNGRTSIAALKVPGVDTQTGLAYNSGTKTVTLSGTITLLSDWNFRNCTVTVAASAIIGSITQCLFGESADNLFNNFLSGTATSRIHDLTYCTFEGAYGYLGCGIAINCTTSGTGAAVTAFDIQRIRYCRFIGLASDAIKAAGSTNYNGQRIEWCYFGPPVNLPQVAPTTWSSLTAYMIGDYVSDTSRNTRPCISLTNANLNNPIPTGTVSDANWNVLDPHSDFITTVASINRISVLNCLFDMTDDPVGVNGPYFNNGLNNWARVSRNTGTDLLQEGVLFDQCAGYYKQAASAASYPIQVADNGLGNILGPVEFRKIKIQPNLSGGYFHPTTDNKVARWVLPNAIAPGVIVPTPTAAVTTDISTAPVNTVVPTLTGTMTVGAVITMAHGTWTGWPKPFADLTLQRSADGSTGWADVATVGLSYTLVTGDANYYFRVKADGYNTTATVNAYSAVSTQVVLGYVQNFVATNATGQLSATPGGTATKVEFSAWVKPQSLTTPAAPRLIRASTGLDIYCSSSGVLNVLIWDSAGTAVYSAVSAAGVIVTTSRQHVYISADWTTQTVVARVNGVLIAMTPSVGPIAGTASLRPNRLHEVMSVAASVANFHASDFYLRYHSATMLGFSAFYNSGVPPEPTALGGSPQILLGGVMRANDNNSGNSAQGWNDGFKLGSSTMTVTSGTYTDA